MIDMHTHAVPTGFAFTPDDDPRWPVVEVSGDGTTADVIVAGRVFRVIRSSAWDFGRRRADMANEQVHMQLVSPMPELFSYWAPAAKARVYCTTVNNWLADRVRDDPSHFAGLGILPMQDVDLAVDQIDEIARLGLAGVELGSNVNGVGIADRRFRPVFESLAGRNLLVFVHAFHPAAIRQIEFASAGPAVTFPLEISFALESLIANGVLADLPTMKLLVSHGGGATSLVLGRLQSLWKSNMEFRTRVREEPYVSARRVFYDTILFDPDALEYLVRFVGASQVVAGSDYPFAPTPARDLLDACRGLSNDTRSRLEYQNAASMLTSLAFAGADDGSDRG